MLESAPPLSWFYKKDYSKRFFMGKPFGKLKKKVPIPRVCSICGEYFTLKNYRILKQRHMAIIVQERTEITTFCAWICSECNKKYFRTTKK